MACDAQKDLATFIKNLHLKLRKEASILGPDKAWEIHCQQKSVLQEYAAAMQELATNYWEKNSEDNSKTAASRILWVVKQCTEYYPIRKLHQRQREFDIITKIDNSIHASNYVIQEEDINNKLKLLDVGSCYNPFKKFDIFDVLAIDLAPANSDVQICDFLKVNFVTGKSNNVQNTISELSKNSFDIVVFSLLLEYMPCSSQRMRCCENAYQVLKPEGLLLVITPDSKHVGANAKLMKSWRFALATIGFMRIKYEKLSHIHCIVFRKCLFPEVAHRWANMHLREFTAIDLNIPQDFYTNVDKEREEKIDDTDDKQSNLFLELPSSS